MLADDTPRDAAKVLAFHCSRGSEQWTPLTGTSRTPTLVYEVTQKEEVDGTPLYEGRIFDAATARMIHPRPYQSTFIEAFAAWWARETGLEPPEELLRGHSCSQDKRPAR